VKVTREDVGNGNPFGPTSLPPREEEVYDSNGYPTGQTTGPDTVSRDGGRQWPIEPAMVFEGKPGEDIGFADRKTPGAHYDDFSKMQVRAGSAGAGVSYDEVARDFDGGNYSSKRMNTIEGRRSYGVGHDLLINEVSRPAHKLFTGFAILEENITPGRYGLGVKLEEFLKDPDGYSEAEFIPDGFENIDALKESSADSIDLDKRLNTRKNIIARRFGGNWRRYFQQIADEQREANRVKIVLPDVEPTPPRNSGDQAPGPNNSGNEADDPEEVPKKKKKGAPVANGNGHHRRFSDANFIIEETVKSAVRETD
jgi:capsid protein